MVLTVSFPQSGLEDVRDRGGRRRVTQSAQASEQDPARLVAELQQYFAHRCEDVDRCVCVCVMDATLCTLCMVGLTCGALQARVPP